MPEPYQLTASEALNRMKAGDLTVTAYATSLLSRIESRDSHTKAWSYISPPSILAAAAALDSIPPSARGPLHGIPIAVKDVILTKDMPTVYNSDIYRSNMAPADTKVDAAPITSLRAMGALIFGKTTTTEFASTTLGGPSCNPHDKERTPGGSSSGSGAAVGDYQCPIGLGTQTGGSTVRPGSFNGIYAFKVCIFPSLFVLVYASSESLLKFEDYFNYRCVLQLLQIILSVLLGVFLLDYKICGLIT